jgi:hypothetical protein
MSKRVARAFFDREKWEPQIPFDKLRALGSTMDIK